MKNKIKTCLIITILTISFLSISTNCQAERNKGLITVGNTDGLLKVNNVYKKIGFIIGKQLEINLRNGGVAIVFGKTYAGPSSITIEHFYGFVMQVWGGTPQVPYEDSKITIIGYGSGML